MTETTRIRWTAGAEASMTAYFGLVANCGPHLFQIFKPVFKGDQHALRSELPGQRYSQRDGDPDTLKAEAERWLAGFVSSLGAIFPDEPGTMLADVSEEEFRVRYAPGRRVRFAHPDAGYLSDREMAFRLLTPDEVYAIEWSDIGFTSSRLGLAGIKSHGQGFSSVLFEPVHDETTAPTAGEEAGR